MWYTYNWYQNNILGLKVFRASVSEALLWWLKFCACVCMYVLRGEYTTNALKSSSTLMMDDGIPPRGRPGWNSITNVHQTPSFTSKGIAAVLIHDATSIPILHVGQGALLVELGSITLPHHLVSNLRFRSSARPEWVKSKSSTLPWLERRLRSWLATSQHTTGGLLR